MPEAPFTRYAWDPRSGRTGRYRNIRTGRYVSEPEVRIYIERYLTKKADELQALTQEMLRGDITLARWRRVMAEQTVTTHGAVTAVSGGGMNNMSPDDWDWFADQMEFHIERLDNFVKDIISGRQPLDGTAVVRSGLYARSGKMTGENLRRQRAADAGLSEERRVRSAFESCPDCVRYAALGWQPLGTLPVIGDSVCRQWCLCFFVFR
jgi:hypothetical protein